MATTAVTANATPSSEHGPLTSADGSAPPKSSADTGMRCPDPSAHETKGSALQNQASAAALYSTNASAANASRNPLGPDGKLSSASAATSLKYAKAQDLPSFPVVGIDTKSSAGAAALLANQNKKSPEWWKPEQSSAAGKAALLANGYKMAPLWQPEASAAGSKAALLAHKDGVKLNLWQPEASADGNSAANIAMRKKNLGPEIDYGYTDQGRKNAFTAATGAHSASGRKRAQSIPPAVPLYPDSKNSAKNALSAATLATSSSIRAKPQATPALDSNRVGTGAMEAARIQHAKSISRDMYTSAPPVALEVDEKRHNEALRASAISMAKKMYDVQQQHTGGAEGKSAARTGATAAHGQQPASGEADIKQQAMRYIGIQEAAQKLAQERLAKIGYDENAAYRSYYGYDQPSRSKLSLRRGRGRARSASDAAPPEDSDSDEDDFRSRRIRNQMDNFNKQLADVDAKKRENDRKSLLAAAQRKVQAQMQGMDKKIYDETGKMSPAMVDDWDEKAKKRALANSEQRMENHGRIHIGNGKWMDQGEIDAIAQARIQPTLDEITEKTERRLAEDEKRRAEEEERRLDLEEKKRRERNEKERAAEIKAEEKQHKDEEKRAAKARAAEAKTVAKQEKETEKAKKAEEERLAKEEQRKSREMSAVPPTATVATATATNTDELYEERSSATAAQRPTEHDTADPTSPTSQGPSKGLKSLLSKLKRRSKHAPATDGEEQSKETEADFIGGAALRSSTSGPQSQSSKSNTQPQLESVEAHPPTDLDDVEPTYVPHLDELEADRYSDISSLASSVAEDAQMTRGRSAERILSVGTATSGGTDFEEARDTFDADLAPPPTFTSDADKARKGSPTRDSKFHEVGL
ncbi:Eisosome assembly protein [Coniothyrium glycines]